MHLRVLIVFGLVIQLFAVQARAMDMWCCDADEAVMPAACASACTGCQHAPSEDEPDAPECPCSICPVCDVRSIEPRALLVDRDLTGCLLDRADAPEVRYIALVRPEPVVPMPRASLREHPPPTDALSRALSLLGSWLN